jgi:pilus assembly protein Flp/PilA
MHIWRTALDVCPARTKRLTVQRRIVSLVWVMYLTASALYLEDIKAVRPLAAKGLNEEHVKPLFQALIRDDSGQDMIEYALVSTLLALSLLAVIRAYNVDIKGSFNGLGNGLTNAMTGV